MFFKKYALTKNYLMQTDNMSVLSTLNSLLHTTPIILLYYFVIIFLPLLYYHYNTFM